MMSYKNLLISLCTGARFSFWKKQRGTLLGENEDDPGPSDV